MANFKYFSDYNGQTIELKAPSSMPNAEFAALFPGVKGMRDDGYSKRVGCDINAPLTWPRVYLPITRMIEYKANPSKHICNAKCLGGKATGVCECQCGGKNHGAGMFSRFVE
jgi:hypothetical protein